MDTRQKRILELVVRDYIGSAQPVSSSRLARRYRLGWSPATIRACLADLRADGFLDQPHVSSGNVPSDKAYRFFVDELGEGDLENQNEAGSRGASVEQLVQYLAEQSRLLSFAIDEASAVWMDGVDYLFSQPDFETRDSLCGLAQIVDEIFDRRVELFDEFEHTEFGAFIGNETPFSAHGALSLIMGSSRAADGRQVELFLMGPTRMPYERALPLVRSALHAVRGRSSSKT